MSGGLDHEIYYDTLGYGSFSRLILNKGCGIITYHLKETQNGLLALLEYGRTACN
jgi:hypothetical protein